MSSSLGLFSTEPTIAERPSPPSRVQPSQALGIISSTGPPSDSGVNDHEAETSDSEAETIVLPERNGRNGTGIRDRGRRRDSPDDDDDDEDDNDSDSEDGHARRSKRPRKRREADPYSSELSSAPSAASSPVRGSSHLRSARNGSATAVKSEHHASSLSRKRKAPIDPEQHTNGSLRNRQPNSPKRITRSSPFSPSPPPISNRTRAIQTSHSSSAKQPSQKTKQRKVPRPFSSLREKRSSEERSPSSSRQGSPAGFPQLPRPSAARTPGSPVNTINMPHKPKRDGSGRTLLHRAAQRGNLEEVINIFNQNRDLLNEEDNAGYIPLHEASLHGHIEVVKFLLSNGSYVDKQSHTDKDTPLMDAVENGHLEVVKLLLEKGADPKIRNKSGADALECMGDDTPDGTAIEEVIRAALQKRRSKRSSDDENRNSAQAESHSSRDPSVASPVHDTAPSKSRQVSGRRRNARADQTKNEMLWVEGGKNGLQKLREKARLGDTSIVHACLERGVEPDVESLIGAIKGGHDDTVSLLLAFGADADPETSRSNSIGKRNSEETPMLAAIGRNNLKILEYLLDKVDPLRKDSHGRSYMDISRERAGDLWEQEVKLLQAACDKATKARGGNTERKVDRSPSSKKKLEQIENPTIKRERARPRRNSIASASTNRRSESIQSKLEDNNSDQDSTIEPKARREDRRPKESDSTIVKKKRRLIPGKELLAEKSSSMNSKNQESRSSNPHVDLPVHVLESRGPQSLKLKTEPKEVDMSDIPEAQPTKRDRSRDRTTVVKPGNTKAITKDALTGKKRTKEIDGAFATQGSKSTSTDSEKKKRKIDADEVNSRDEAIVRKVKKATEVGNGRPKDLRREDARIKRLDSETRSDASGKEEDMKKATKDQEALRARRLAKEEEKKKRLAQEEEMEKMERKRRKAEEAERKEQEQVAQRRAEEERATKEREQREISRLEHLVSEQKSIMTKAHEESNRCREECQVLREALERERLERIAEEARQKELQRVEMERLREEEKRQAEERRREEEEAEKRRIAEEEEQRLRIEEESRSRAAAEEKLQHEAAERRRLEEEAEIQRQFEETRRQEEEAEKRRIFEERNRQAEARRRESLPVGLRLAAEAPSVPSVIKVGDYLPLYQATPYENNGDILPNGNAATKSSGWILNIQAALILGTTDLSLQEYHIESRDISDEHKFRMWMLLTPILCTQRTFESTNEEIFADQRVNKEKFMHINPLFWLKLDDFYSILQSDQKYAHLLAKGVLRTTWVDLVFQLGEKSTPASLPSI